MNMLLVNLDLTIPDFYQDISSILGSDKLSLISYIDANNEVTIHQDSWSLGGAIKINPDNLSSLITVSPGVNSLKSLHKIFQSELSKNEYKVHLIIYLAEFWLIQKLEKVNPFMFEAYRTYLSSILSLGYPRSLMVCSSKASSEYYASSILGGFEPRVAGIETVSKEFGIIKHVPLGLA